MTEAEFWVERGGMWRKARRLLHCANRRCHHAPILPGTRYLDTGERAMNATWATIKECAECAARVMD